jgi:hypothetical protein
LTIDCSRRDLLGEPKPGTRSYRRALI